MSGKDRFLTRSEFALLAAGMSDGLEPVDIPTPAILKPMELWTGKQLFSVLVRPNARTKWVKVSGSPELQLIGTR